MKFDAWPVEPPGLGSGPLSIRTRSLQPRRTRWWTRLLPTIPAPMTTARAVRGRTPAAPDCSSTEVTSGSWRMAGNLIYHTAMHSSRELRSSSFEVRVDGRPARLKEVVVGAEPQAILEAIDDRAISRLVVEDGEPADRTGLVVEGGEPADGAGLVVE